MKRHTNLWNEIEMYEIEMNEPDTSWHSTLVGVVIMIAVCTIILYGMVLIEVISI